METKVCSKCNIKKDVTEFYSGRRKCKPCYSEQKKKYRSNNIEKVKQYYKDYYYTNHDMLLDKRKRYRENNKESIDAYKKVYRKEYDKRKWREDIIFKTKKSVSNLIRQSLYNTGYKKNSRSFEILGCSFEYFKEHIESQFEDWMNWDNYGIYNGKEKCGWDYDHIVPVSSAECEEDVYKLNHYSNIQPLCSYINRNVKRDIIDWES